MLYDGFCKHFSNLAYHCERNIRFRNDDYCPGKILESEHNNFAELDMEMLRRAPLLRRFLDYAADRFYRKQSEVVHVVL
jgi:hypothetical protein